MVAPATRRFHHPRRLRRLRDMGRIPERSLHIRTIPVAVLLAGDLRRSANGVVRREARMVAFAAPVLAGADHSAVPGSVSFYLLLLSRRVLQGVLGGSAELRGR